MKPRRLILLIAVLLGICNHSLACGPYEWGYTSAQSNLFCLSLPEARECKTREQNIADWQRQTSRAIPAQDVEEVVYKWPVECVESLLGKNQDTSGNSFAQWLVRHNDTDAIKFLVLAKRCENARASQNTRWYYQFAGTSAYQTLDSIQQEAEAYKGKRLADRYAFQVMRALIGKSDYKGCVDYWKRHKHLFMPGSAVAYMAEDYAIGSTQQISGEKKSYAEAFRAMPEIEWPLQEIAQRIRGLESEPRNSIGYPEEAEEDTLAYRAIYEKILPILNDCKGPNKAQWYYVGAFVAGKLGDMDVALFLIKKAAAAATDAAIRDNVRVLALYLRAKNQKRYDRKFEKYLFGELQWLTGKMRQNLTRGLCLKISRHGSYNHLCGFSQYYWSDAMRKILIGGVAPLCFRSGDKVRGLQYLNFADNCIFNMVDKVGICEYDKDYNEHWHYVSPDDFRYLSQVLPPDKGYRTSVDSYSPDYSGDYFMSLDSIGVETVVALAHRIEHPESALDRFLNKGSYTDPQFLADIIGTQYIDAMDYAKAVKYLKRVSPQFNRSRPIYVYTNRNPFNDGKSQPYDPLYKLHFTQKMAVLSNRIAAAKNPDDKAELMLEYNRAIINSTRRCWSLTTYYEGRFINFPYFGHRMLDTYNRMFKFVKEQNREAYALFTDNERAAEAYCKYGLYATAAAKYPGTNTVKRYRAKCDNMYDYNISARRNPREEAWWDPIKSKWDYDWDDR